MSFLFGFILGGACVSLGILAWCALTFGNQDRP
jgi:hypothetical protein